MTIRCIHPRQVIVFACVLTCFVFMKPEQVRAQGVFQNLLKAFSIEKQAEPASVPMVMPRVVEDGEIDPSHAPTLSALLNAELHLLNKVCKPTAAQLEEIKAEGTNALRVISGQIRMGTNTNDNAAAYRDLLTDVLLKKSQEIFPEEVAQQYKTELELRREERKTAGATLAMRQIDLKATLTKEQQQEVVKVLIDAKDQGWNKPIAMLLYPQYSPLPDTITLKGTLTDRQMKILSESAQNGRIHLGWEGELGFGGHFASVRLPDVSSAVKETESKAAIGESKQ
ncbi:hypothetical protein SH668x_003800 [Planctomicrobium sp. SH668]|uniref:hypothetical protein n=1 Tax=Planctomicrobium sp. SH668 TaxID=3448126 RepID=UPI003F5B1192